MDAEGHIVITDFGLSREFGAHEKEKRAYSFCGTIEYMAPEIVKGGNHGHDIVSLLFFRTEISAAPVFPICFEISSPFSAFRRHFDFRCSFSQAVDWWSLGVLTYELLTGASPFTVEGDKNTQQDISKRIINAEPLMPDFLSLEVKDFILKLLVKDPRKRLGKRGTREYRELLRVTRQLPVGVTFQYFIQEVGLTTEHVA